jgi:hypothetical protein
MRTKREQQERKWVVSDLALADEREFFKDADGSLSIPVEFARLLVFLGQQVHWETHPMFESHTLDCYLLAVYRTIYHTPTWIVPLVLEELRSQRRTHKPSPSFVQSLCGAAVAMQRDWKNVGFAHTYRPEEPDLACRRRRRRTVIDDD